MGLIKNTRVLPREPIDKTLKIEGGYVWVS